MWFLNKNHEPILRVKRAHRTSVALPAIAGLIAVLVFGCIQVSGQDQDAPNAFERAPFQPVRASNDIDMQIDGQGTEAVWNDASVITDLRLVSRAVNDIPKPDLNTTVKTFYNDRGLYVFFEMEQQEKTFVMVQSTKDGGFLNRDFVTVALDTQGEGKHGYYFTLFLGGSKHDGTLSAERNWHIEWDGAWQGETSHHNRGWSAEFFIPWSMLEMPFATAQRKMALWVSRRVQGVDETHSWPAISDYASRFLSDLNPVVFQNVMPSEQLNVTPFVSTNIDRINSSSEEQIGVNVDWRPSTDFRLSGTVLPDFGTAEADDVIVNLTVFETFFPEQRSFFKERQEDFTPDRTFGSGGNVLFHPRRIGGRPSIPTVDSDVSLDLSRLSNETDLIGAVRGAGSTGKWQYAMLGAWEDSTTFGAVRDGENLSISVPGRDFGVVHLVHDDSMESFWKFQMLATARWDPTAGDAYSYTFDGRYLNPFGKVAGQSRISISDVDGEEVGFGGFADIAINTRRGRTHIVSIETNDDKLNLNAMGYNRRNNQTWLNYSFNHTDNSPYVLRAISTGFFAQNVWDSDGDRTFTNIGIVRRFDFVDSNSAEVSLSLIPTHLDDTVAYRVDKFGTEHAYRLLLNWTTDNTEEFHYGISTGYQKEAVEGGRFWLEWKFGVQPTESFKLNVQLLKRFRTGWLRYRGGGRYTRFEAWEPRVAVAAEYLIDSTQQIHLDFQWQAAQGKGLEFYTVPAGTTKLISTGNPTQDFRDDFGVSQLLLHIRYRWEIAPVSDLSVVFTKTARLNRLIGNSTFETLRDQLQDSDTEMLAAKIRYRFGM